MNLSIVIPVYNVEKFLHKCVESVVNQKNLFNYEIILVDDGSTDNSGLICDSLAEKHQIIKVFHKKNGGLMSAWKYGVTKSNGKYIGFVDSDDWVDDNMFSILLDKAVKTEADMICCGFVKEFSDGKKENISNYFQQNIIDYKEIEEHIYPVLLYNPITHSRSILPNRYTKLYKKDLLLLSMKYCNDNISIGEDLLTIFSYMTSVKRMCFINNFFPYHYRINSQSMTQTYSKKKYKYITDLKHCMELVNEKFNYNFETQINYDYTSLMLAQLDCEMLFSESNTKNLIKSIKQFCNNNEFRAASSACKISKLSCKNMLYLILLKLHLYILLIAIRKLSRIKTGGK